MPRLLITMRLSYQFQTDDDGLFKPERHDGVGRHELSSRGEKAILKMLGFEQWVGYKFYPDHTTAGISKRYSVGGMLDVEVAMHDFVSAVEGSEMFESVHTGEDSFTAMLDGIFDNAGDRHCAIFAVHRYKFHARDI